MTTPPLNAQDEGDLDFLVGVAKGKVVVSFPKPIKWIGMAPDQAVGLAQLLVRHALKAGHDKPVTFTLGDD